MSERLKLVRSFDELRAGMVVVVGCGNCAQQHRGILTSLETVGWAMDAPPHGHMFVIPPGAVAR